MHVLATDPDPDIVRLPWHLPLEEWEGPWVLDVPRGLSRHVVRVVRAEPGACAQSASETGARCVARGGDQYVSNDSGNLSVYAYGNGYEVEVGGRPATGIAPIPSGLTADQLSAAASAVLATLG